jgi:integrase
MPRALGDGKGFVERRVKKKVGGRTVTETRLYVRVRVTDPDGRRRSMWRRVENRTEGKEALRELVGEARAPAGEDRAEKTFGDLANHYESTSLVPAEYRDGRKVSGRRSLHGMGAHLRFLCAFFGAAYDEEARAWRGGAPLASVTYDRLAELRAAILAEPVHVTEKNPLGRPRKIASVNRRLEVLRNMLRVAARKGWVAGNPFAAGPALISAADEVKRVRVLSFEEEDRLLAQCVSRTELRPPLPPRNVRREHLRAIVVCALDTAMREGEIFKLRWPDLDRMSANGRRALTVQQMNTKTLQERGAPVSKRLMAEFELLRASRPDPEGLVFGVTTSVKRAFAGACRDAGITGLRFHDLRRTAATRLHRDGMPIGEISRILGHADPKTTYRYIGVDEETTERAAEAFDRIEGRRDEARRKRMRGAA